MKENKVSDIEKRLEVTEKVLMKVIEEMSPFTDDLLTEYKTSLDEIRKEE